MRKLEEHPLVTFEEDTESQECKVTFERRAGYMTICVAPGNRSFFCVVPDRGSVPSALEGVYTTLNSAKRCILMYANTMPWTKKARSDDFIARREERKNAERMEVDGELDQDLTEDLTKQDHTEAGS